MAIRYVNQDTTELYSAARDGKRLIDLLWGDRVRTVSTSGGMTKVKARGREGWVPSTHLGKESLLEIYFIDVGQGDGVLIRTPDHRHILIDGGWPRANQDTGKNAADFVDWKFVKDYGEKDIALDVMIASHNDADHYGGLWDLLNVEESHQLDAKHTYVEEFYHGGVSWYTSAEKKRFLGPTIQGEDGTYLSMLLNDRNDAVKKLKAQTKIRLQGEWAKFIQCVTETKRFNGQTPTRMQRLSDCTEFLPGFSGGASPVPGLAHGDVSIKVLGPVEFEISNKPVLKSLGNNSVNTNGNSVLLRVDYGRARIMMTGDLNKDAQHLLLDAYEGRRLEFLCDVAKACHHGSDKVSYEFLQAMTPAVTVISSGDNESHDHPRPAIVAASATTGHLVIKDDEIVSPLVYSTELSRSVSLGTPFELEVPDEHGSQRISGARFDESRIHYTETKSGERRPRTRVKKMQDCKVVAGLIYGLVNVRTNGQKILCATMNEKDYSWNVKAVEARF